MKLSGFSAACVRDVKEKFRRDGSDGYVRRRAADGRSLRDSNNGLDMNMVSWSGIENPHRSEFKEL